MIPSAQSDDDLLADVLSRNSHRQGVDDEQDLSLAEPRIIECLIDSCSSVLSTMCKIAVVPDRPCPGYAPTQHELSGVISVKGPISLTVVVNLSKDFAFRLAEALIGAAPTEIDADVIDLVGELANMIVGNAKERLRHKDLALGLPTVVTGMGHHVVLSKDLSLSYVEFASEAGSLQIQLGVS